MELQTLLDKYQGSPLDHSELSDYQIWALSFFHDEEQVLIPGLGITIQLDITAADKRYRAAFASLEGASMTGYLIWHLLEVLKKHPCFQYRKIDETWYEFKSLPLFFPVAVGGAERFRNVLMEDVCQMSIAGFFKDYRRKINAALDPEITFAPIDNDIWNLAIFAGNLPGIQFSSFNIHIQARKTGRPYFYFGKRYQEGGKMLLPVSVFFDHSNTDPYVVSLLFEDYTKALAGE